MLPLCDVSFPTPTMNNFEELHKYICRLCLNYGNKNNMVLLVDENKSNGLTAHGEAVLQFANISIKENFPPSMCCQCLKLLKQAIQFKLLCERSDKILKELDNGNVKEKIVEYSLLRLYFPEEFSRSNLKKTEKTVATIEFAPENSKPLDDINEGSSEKSICEDDDKLLDDMERMMCSDVFKTIKQKPFKRKKKLKRKHSMVTQNIKFKKKMKQSMVCGVCNKVLANQLTYDHHMQRHNGCRFICEHCGKGFPIRAELQFHQVCRHGVGPYIQCSRCPFKAPRKFDLIEHERIHTGERPYACEKCGLTFRRRGIWKKHLLYHAEKKIQCPHCPKKFYQRGEMLAHANSNHDRVYMYLCNKCGATYAKPATVRRHMTERHGVPREMQGKITRINKDASFKDK